MASTGKFVLPLSRDIIVGWEERFVMSGEPSETIEVTTAYSNVPARGFAFIDKFTSVLGQRLQLLDANGFPLSEPGKPIDLMDIGSGVRISPIEMGPDVGVRINIRCTGLIPERFKPGSKRRLTIMFIASEPVEF